MSRQHLPRDTSLHTGRHGCQEFASAGHLLNAAVMLPPPIIASPGMGAMAAVGEAIFWALVIYGVALFSGALLLIPLRVRDNRWTRALAYLGMLVHGALLAGVLWLTVAVSSDAHYILPWALAPIIGLALGARWLRRPQPPSAPDQEPR